MNKGKRHSIPSFTIFEVTVVLAIMSILAAMVSFSVNRLFDSMHTTETIHTELNNFYRVRSTLWYDCITADSMQCANNKLHVYSDAKEVNYHIEEGILFRTKNGISKSMEREMEEIKATPTEFGIKIQMRFEWKGETLEWEFLNRPDRAGSINQFFERRNG